jgi:hypothetical protein
VLVPLARPAERPSRAVVVIVRAVVGWLRGALDALIERVGDGLVCLGRCMLWRIIAARTLSCPILALRSARLAPGAASMFPVCLRS